MSRRRKPGPDRKIDRAEVERRLARRIRAWAETWKRCPRKGCRRARACSDFDHCAARSTGEGRPLSEAFTRRLLAAVAAERARRGLPPRPGYGPTYDPEAREPLPPLPSTPPEEG